MSTDYAPTSPSAFDPFDPHADEHVARLVRRLRAIERKTAETARLAAAEHAEVDACYRPQLDGLAAQAEQLRALIGPWALAMRERSGGRWKSTQFAAGTVATRETTHWEWPENVHEVIDALYSMRLDEMVRVVHSPDKAALKKRAQIKDGHAYIDGEELPGVTVEQRIHVTVTPANPGNDVPDDTDLYDDEPEHGENQP